MEKINSGPKRTHCIDCPLRRKSHFRDLNEEELAFVDGFKVGELSADPGATIFSQGTNSAHIYTILDGAAFRFKILEDGRRQILNYVFPGDMVGLQSFLMGEMQYSVESLSNLRLCVFERGRMMTLFEKHPSLAYDVTWLAAREERMLDENLLSVGRRTALERIAYFLAFLYRRAMAVGLADGTRLDLPITQRHVADTLGLSLVHTNKTLRRLTDRGLARWRDSSCEVLDPDGLQELAGWEGLSDTPRPFI
ncbi:CRP-like cAMP-binding protein [Rhodobium orientis]|uniref:Crp/Fnr family transcriptional regulator n=1 Tax=Rhodobium orientis TaxID=34017 RepID=A0A327JTC5_9HYPH|nr:Crp/Fnr family transcriptional regulator [Rhodobium orientis]MBB4302718.1 CRP-like cAMP-binding protein [Rhodobium orientis]MBK5948500.1 Crp/Fnr family transcriptional regulator [Rhodobium orientis]RAI29770.1 Crp/Fnr family transcriptional regulator [Rhodobium orientis]